MNQAQKAIDLYNNALQFASDTDANAYDAYHAMRAISKECLLNHPQQNA